MYIDSTDAKEREVVASYMIPAPVWKSSYRLIFGASGQPVLEGWAIVDNTTGEDWTKVQLSLVSGRPISFVSQLYAPKYVDRPSAELADDRAARPVVHEGGFDANAGIGRGEGGGVGGGVNRLQQSRNCGPHRRRWRPVAGGPWPRPCRLRPVPSWPAPLRATGRALRVPHCPAGDHPQG